MPVIKTEIIEIRDEYNNSKENDAYKDKLFLGDRVVLKTYFTAEDNYEDLVLQIKIPHNVVLVPTENIIPQDGIKNGIYKQNDDYQYIEWKIDKALANETYSHVYELVVNDQFEYDNSDTYSFIKNNYSHHYKEEMELIDRLYIVPEISYEIDQRKENSLWEKDIFVLVSGNIVGPYGRPVPAVEVYFEDSKGKISNEEFYADMDGKYEIPLSIKDMSKSIFFTILFRSYIDQNDSDSKVYMTSTDDTGYSSYLRWVIQMYDFSLSHSKKVAKNISQDISIYNNFQSSPKPTYPLPSSQGGDDNLFYKTAMAAEDIYWIYNGYKLMKEQGHIDKYTPLDVYYKQNTFTGAGFSHITMEEREWEFLQDRKPHILLHELVHIMDKNNWGYEKFKKFYSCSEHDNCKYGVSHLGYANDYSENSFYEAIASFLPQYMYSKISGEKYSRIFNHRGTPIDEYEEIDNRVMWAIGEYYKTKFPNTAIPENEGDAIIGLWQHIFGDLTDEKVSEFLSYYRDSSNISDFYDKISKSSREDKHRIDELFIRAGIFYDANGNWKYDEGEEIGRPANGASFYANMVEYYDDGSRSYTAGNELIPPRPERRIPPIIGSEFIFNTNNTSKYIDDKDFNIKRYYNEYSIANIDLSNNTKEKYNIKLFNNQKNSIELPNANNLVIITADNSSNYYSYSSEEYFQATRSTNFAYINVLDFNYLTEEEIASGVEPMTIEKAIEIEKSLASDDFYSISPVDDEEGTTDNLEESTFLDLPPVISNLDDKFEETIKTDNHFDNLKDDDENSLINQKMKDSRDVERVKEQKSNETTKIKWKIALLEAEIDSEEDGQIKEEKTNHLNIKMTELEKIESSRKSIWQKIYEFLLNVLNKIKNFFIGLVHAQDNTESPEIYFTPINSDTNQESQIDNALVGQTVVINARNFNQSKNIQIYLDDTFLEDAKILGGGFGIKVKMPLDIKSGNYTMKVIGDAQGEYVFKEIYIEHPRNYNWIYYPLAFLSILILGYIIYLLKKRKTNSQDLPSY